MRLPFWFFLSLLCLLTPLAHATDVLPLPAMDSLVTDPNGVLSYSQRHDLTQKLHAFEQRKGSQIAVLIVPTTRPEDVFSYAFRVAKAWKLGRAGMDDGVLVVIATDDHTDDIQVGYGLEGALPDARCKQILQDTMAPFFKTVDYAGGLNAGVDALISAAGGESFLSFHRSGGWTAYLLGLVAGLGCALVLGLLAGRSAGGVIGGLIGGGVAFAMGAPASIAIMIGALVALVVSPQFHLTSDGGIGYGNPDPYDRAYRRGYNDGRWRNNSSGSSSSGNSNSDSGGGGSFGGGGSSGNW
jgi:uncharacterized protein